ncbi:flagellar filament capping protein FliD [Duganella sp. FT80W]|uniref:Flagellar hook-associated protein 2 n=1 Tax=Duganella guangzhouensis TaxID=2666084 RepID=A0A6I2L8L2_9BURK|nr:flagellar filament capping protein FliD [Duganella guangzhouensis]MRW94585.1 flagellar filament capping protein FliD [Duganella guangzhouensis]
MATSSISSTTSSTTSTVSTDVYNRVEQVMSSQTTAANKLNASLTSDQTKLSALGQLQSALANFQQIAAGLTGDGLSTTAASSASSVLSATSTGSAKSGTYAVEVQQLAQGQFLTSAASSSASAAIGSGASTTVKIEFGTDGDGGFKAGSTASKTITIDSSNNTLDGIAAALKTAGVDASVVKGSDGQYTLNIAGQSGAANSMRINVSGDASVKNLLAYDPDGTQNLTQTAAAQDAILTVDGKQVTSASNTVKDSAISGATLNLTAAGKSNVTVTQDSSQIGANLKAFVSAYNDLNAKMLKLQSGDLQSDTALKQAMNQMSLLIKTGGGSVSVTALAKAGVSQDAKGNLVLDDGKLQTALSTDSASIAKLFTNDGSGIADLLSAKAAALTGDNSVLTKETTQTTNEIATLTAKKTKMTAAMTTQATALAALYSAQSETGSGSAINGTSSGTGTLFDMLG